MPGERGFEREVDWTQGPAKWAAAVVLGAACMLTSAWVITGRVRVERAAQAAGGPVAGEQASLTAPAAAGPEATLPTSPPPLSLVGEALGPTVDEVAPVERPSAPEVAPQTVPSKPEPVAGGVTRRINVNTATGAELELLPGVGPKLAARIVEHRRTHGAFKRVEDLDAVSGIGPRILERLRPLVTVE